MNKIHGYSWKKVDVRHLKGGELILGALEKKVVGDEYPSIWWGPGHFKFKSRAVINRPGNENLELMAPNGTLHSEGFRGDVWLIVALEVESAIPGEECSP